MFAPYCPTCACRQLLGFGRLVAGNWERGGTLYVRCHCGTVVAADNPVPAPTPTVATLRPTG